MNANKHDIISYICYMLHKENNKHFIAVLHRTVKVGPSMWSITGTEVECKAGSQPAVERYSQTLLPIDTSYNDISTMGSIEMRGVINKGKRVLMHIPFWYWLPVD